MKSINPTTEEIISNYAEHSAQQVNTIIEEVNNAFTAWKDTSFSIRASHFLKAADILRTNKQHYAALITLEMGKLIRESLAEVEKCATVCEYYANQAENILRDEVIESDAQRSFVTFQPLGVILAVMPWNFPFWQLFRFAAPTMMAGNGALLKHASNVPGCALAIEEIFVKAGFPLNIFRTLMISSSMVEEVVVHPKVKAITLTGSESAGSHVAAAAGKCIKKSVLELGGSDPFILLDDADMDQAVQVAVKARMINQGQSCIAAKRFIVVESRITEFEEKIAQAFQKLVVGNPLEETTDVGPMARLDLIEDLEHQVKRSIAMGARLIQGGGRYDRKGYYYQPTILSDVRKGMPVYHEETFGPVVSIIKVKDETEAIEVANDSPFGLGGSVWTTDRARGERVARKIETGAMFVNGLTKSDPRLPFGGINKSGFGRELGTYGIKEFVNIKTIWIG